MNILIVVPTAHGGGAEFVAMTWARELLDRGSEVSVFTTARSSRPEGVAANVGWFGPPEKSSHVGIQRSLRRVVRENSFDVILALQQYPNLHAIVAKFGRGCPPVVISERNLVSIGKSRQGFNHRVKVALAQVIYRKADRVVAISHAVAADLISSFRVMPSKCIVVPNPALAKVELVGEYASMAAEPMRELPEYEITIILACRLVSQKRPLHAVDAAAELVRRGKSVRLVLFGGGPLRDQVVAQAQSSGVFVDDRGWAEKWFYGLPSGSVHVLPSDQEGLANTLIEAAGSGIRSVAYSRALGVGDSLIPGVTGALVREEGAVALADAIESQAGKDVRGVDAWLAQFSSTRSTDEVERVLADAACLRSPDKAITAMQIGGAGDIVGGLSQVVQSLGKGVPGFRVSSRPTRSTKSVLQSVRRTVRGAIAIVARTPNRNNTVLAVHLSQQGSFVREGALVAVGSALGFAIAIHLHGSSFEHFSRTRPRLARSILGRASTVLTLSEESEAAVARLVPSATVVRLPNWVDVPKKMLPRDKAVIFGGVVGHRKGVDVLLDAWRSIDTSDWELQVYGPLAPDFDLREADLPANVHLFGPVSHETLLTRLASSSIAVLPSRAEALPLFILEAMAAGNPIIASDVGGIGDVVDDTVGVLVQPGDAHLLADALQLLMTDEEIARLRGSNARARIEANYGTARGHSLVAEAWCDALRSKGYTK